jgi:hypothetical protein
MRGFKTARLVTALAVISICIWPVWQGFNLIRYAMIDDTPEASRSWVNVPGLSFVAREDSLTPVDDSSDDKTIRKRRDEIAEILATRPLSSRYWLKLAEARVDAGDPLSQALEALQLSVVTGPNEGYMITQRGLFGIWQWEVLPPEVKARAVADLAARQLSDAKLAWLKTTLSEKPAKVREEIRAALQAQGFSKSNFDRIGL